MPKPKEGESQKDFIQRCIPIVLAEGTAKDNDQAVAMCNSMYTQEMKLETKEINNVEIFETGTWKGIKYTEKDLDEMVNNFNNGVAEPYITIDHSSKATSQFKDALQALELGFVKSLKRNGTKLIAGFKQVPKTIAELIDGGPLKKKSIEFCRQIIANGKSYKNVLQGVTFHGANGLPEVNTLSDFLTLYKSNLQTMDKTQEDIVSISIKDKEAKSMENIELKRDEYQELLKKSSQVDVFQNEVESFKKDMTDMKENFKKLTDENEKLKKEHEDFEKSKKESLKSEADEYISKKINDGFIKPAHKDRYVAEYIMYKTEKTELFDSFKEDIESRGKVIDVTPTPGKGSSQELFKYNPDEIEFKAGATIDYDELNSRIEAVMKAKKISWEDAAIECNAVVPEEINKEEVAK